MAHVLCVTIYDFFFLSFFIKPTEFRAVSARFHVIIDALSVSSSEIVIVIEIRNYYPENSILHACFSEARKIQVNDVEEVLHVCGVTVMKSVDA